MSWFKNIFSFQKTQCECQTPTKNLSEVASGHRVRVQCIKGEEATCQRLREMGFCESSVVEKVADSGALICKVCDSRVVISKELAENIMVKDVCPIKGHEKSGDKKSVFLSQMTVGQRGIIDNFVVESEDGERVEEMGVTPGEQVEVIRYAPLGDPIEIRIRGYHLSLRKQEADRIKVNLL